MAQNKLRIKGVNTGGGGGNLTDFISVWDANLGKEPSIELPLVASGNYNFSVNWGDGNTDTITAWDQSERMHIYATVGVYTVTITGTIEGWSFVESGIDGGLLTSITNIGPLKLGNEGGYFQGCSNLTTIGGTFDLTGTTNFTSMFQDCNSLTSINGISSWNVSSVTSMSSMFNGTPFNQPLNSWDVSSVTNMNDMFANATAFNQDISSWDVSSVTNMSAMFYEATAFNQPLNSWDVSSVTNMSEMFMSENSTMTFNQPLNLWNVSSVINMANMFDGVSNATAFNQDISAWDISNVTNMTDFMRGATTADYDYYDDLLIAWSVLTLQNGVTWGMGSIEYTGGAGSDARQDIIDNYSWTITDGGKLVSEFISVWNTTLGDGNPSITLPLVQHFGGNYDFTVNWGDGNTDTITAWNQAEKTHTYEIGGVYTVTISGTIEGWSFNNTGSCEKLTSITNIGPLKLGDNGGNFNGCTNLTTISGTFDLTGVTQFNFMFQYCSSLTSVNGIEDWDTSAVNSMYTTFNGATLFNQDISGWDISSVNNMASFMANEQTYSYYDDLLNAWSQLTLQNGVTWGMGSIEYTNAGADARQDIIDNYSWTITDGGKLVPEFISVWDTTLCDGNPTITLPLVDSGNYNFSVNWGDGNTDTITAWDQEEVTHTYATGGVKTITITGTIEGWSFERHNEIDCPKLTSITNIGPLKLGNEGGYFAGCSNLTTIGGIFDLTGTTNLGGMFAECSSLTSVNGIGSWDVSAVTTMNSMFNQATAFNQDISGWDTSAVTSMRGMFGGAVSFNQNIGGWDVSAVTSMDSMFKEAASFNQPLNSWDVSAVTNMNSMFEGATAFNQNISVWDISNVNNMRKFMYNKSTANYSYYDNLLNAWSQLTLQNGVIWDMGTIEYTGAGATARAFISDKNGFDWTIIDGGLAA